MLDRELTEGVKRHDPDRYRAALFAPRDVRRDLTTLYAFYYQIARVHDVASEPMIAQIRLQWWREAVDEIYSDGRVRTHEVTVPLAHMIRRRGLDRFSIDKLIDARERDITAEPLKHKTDADDYLNQTAGRLMSLAADICGADGDYNRLARAWGYCGLVRTGLTKIGRDNVMDLAYGAYSEAMKQEIPGDALPATAYVTLVPGYLKRQSPDGELPFSLFRRQLLLFRAIFRGRV